MPGDAQCVAGDEQLPLMPQYDLLLNLFHTS